MRGNDLDNRVSHLAATPVSDLFRRAGFLAPVWFVAHAQVGAKDVKASLPVLLPFISKPCHCMHPGEPHHRLVVAELRNDCRKPLVEHPGSDLRGDGLGRPRPPASHSHKDRRPGHRREHQHWHTDQVVHRHPETASVNRRLWPTRSRPLQ